MFRTERWSLPGWLVSFAKVVSRHSLLGDMATVDSDTARKTNVLEPIQRMLGLRVPTGEKQSGMSLYYEADTIVPLETKKVL